jgi:MHS family proline/betaine transporter-like MFS transporter
MAIFSSLRREEREAVALLQIGTILEYFDLMLYVHMAVVLNDLFFPKTDPHTSDLLTAFAFCSTFVLRPFGAIIFGYIGDHIGRKTTVIITTMMMAASCLVMANLPTYAQIGITAAWAVTACRVIQGLSSMGEIVGAEIYLTELIKSNARYPAVALMACSSAFGTMMALTVAMLVFALGLEWRLAFWFGACIAVVGTLARTRLRETPDFADMKRRMRRAVEESSHDGLEKASQLLQKTNMIWKEKVDWKSTGIFFMLYSAWPVCFYFSYIHCGLILKNTFHYTADEIIKQNFIVSIIQCFSFLFFALISGRIDPLRILKFKVFMMIPFVLICPYLLFHVQTPMHLFLIQSFVMLFSLTPAPAMPIFVVSFPIFKRFTFMSFLYATTRALMYVVTSFGLVWLTKFYGHWGLWVIMMPMCATFLWGVYHFENREKEFKKPLAMVKTPEFSNT